MTLVHHNFWSHVRWRAAEHFNLFVNREASAKPKVNKLYSATTFIRASLNQYIFKLDISMGYALACTVVKTLQNLFYDAFGLLLLDLFVLCILLKVIVETSSCEVLHYKVDIVIILKSFENPYNVFVIHFLE